MSRIGRLPVEVPAGVKVTLDGSTLTVKGAKTELTKTFNSAIKINMENNHIICSRESDEKNIKALHGLTRALIADMVAGVTKGFSKTLEISEGGYRAQLKGKQLVLNLGFSHEIFFDEKDGITFEVPDPNKVIVHGADKQKVGQVASEIRSKRPPEPYLGKGVKYAGEKIRRKAGKAGK
ncbi:50S ribosomal protein L6 [bioreactor metagenome]|uniref:50S ribosomal protein L6 n=1 Tax=bioreactor metagenome TaxID=1076179 RepID=A0A645D6D8_9ZZZZ|nr:50S ribosomal protein L6 [Oscillospiraceae bacterium]